MVLVEVGKYNLYVGMKCIGFFVGMIDCSMVVVVGVVGNIDMIGWKKWTGMVVYFTSKLCFGLGGQLSLVVVNLAFVTWNLVNMGHEAIDCLMHIQMVSLYTNSYTPELRQTLAQQHFHSSIDFVCVSVCIAQQGLKY